MGGGGEALMYSIIWGCFSSPQFCHRLHWDARECMCFGPPPSLCHSVGSLWALRPILLIHYHHLLLLSKMGGLNIFLVWGCCSTPQICNRLHWDDRVWFGFGSFPSLCHSMGSLWALSNITPLAGFDSLWPQFKMEWHLSFKCVFMLSFRPSQLSMENHTLLDISMVGFCWAM